MLPVFPLLGGCSFVTASVGSDGTTFHYAGWVTAGVVVIGIGVVGLGVAMMGRVNWSGWGLVACGVLVALAAPLVTRDTVTVNARGFYVPSRGTWLHSGRRYIDFDSIASVRVTHGWIKGLLVQRIYVLHFNRKDGSSVRFPLENDVDRAAARAIHAGVVHHRIPIIRQR